jgi:hypothetical protein
MNQWGRAIRPAPLGMLMGVRLANSHQISFHAGETFEMSLTYTDSDGCPLNLGSGYTCQMDGRLTSSTAESVFSWSSSGGEIVLANSNPNIQINVSSSETGLISAPVSGVYDIKLSNTSTGVVKYIMSGTFKIIDPVTP